MCDNNQHIKNFKSENKGVSRKTIDEILIAEVYGSFKLNFDVLNKCLKKDSPTKKDFEFAVSNISFLCHQIKTLRDKNSKLTYKLRSLENKQEEPKEEIKEEVKEEVKEEKPKEKRSFNGRNYRRNFYPKKLFNKEVKQEEPEKKPEEDPEIKQEE